MSASVIDEFLLQAAREVDVLAPGAPPIAPAIEDRLRASEVNEARGRLSRAWNPEGYAHDGCPQEVHDDGKCFRR